MTRPEAIAFLKWLSSQTDICYACKDCLNTKGCELVEVIELLEREQEEDDRLDALRFATMEMMEEKYPKFVAGVRKAREEDAKSWTTPILKKEGDVSDE